MKTNTTQATVDGLITEIAAGDLAAVAVLEDAIAEGIEGKVLYVAVTAPQTKHRGVIHAAKREKDAFAAVRKGESVRLFGVLYGEDGYDVEYKVGDQAEYDSFNLSYLGKIVAITAAGVTIEENHGNGSRAPQRHRLSVYQFSWRNRHGVEAKRERNSEMWQTL